MTSSVGLILGPGEMAPASGGLSLLIEARRLVEPADGVTIVLAGPAAAAEELAAQRVIGYAPEDDSQVSFAQRIAELSQKG